MKNYAVEIGQALVDSISAIAVANGIKCVAQGDFMSYFSPGFRDVMPAVLVEIAKSDMFDLMMGRLELDYPFRILVLRQQLEAENSYVETMQLASRVWEAVCTSTGPVQNRPAWMSIPIDGAQYVKVRASAPYCDNHENKWLALPETRANCAFIDVVATVRSLKT